MIVIPQNLPNQVAPLTWLLGTWIGWGTKSSPEGNKLVTFQFDAQVVGERVRTVLKIYDTDSIVELDAHIGALEGEHALGRSRLASEETAYWHVLDDAGQKYLQVTSTCTEGVSGLWVGKVQGPRIRLLLDTAARHEGAPAVSKGERMLGLVNSDIFFTRSYSVEDGELVTSGRVARVADPEPIETFERQK
ncbi:MAG: heme-binding beta-barrel domain-containing protein [Actinomycetaceae bacterium]|nr:heme-binding beta-barrel domain-containing protein [Actinomycetaceae bacterium]